MAYSSELTGGGLRLPSIDYTLTKPMNVLGAINSGLDLGNTVMDQPNTNRARQIVTKQQGLILNDKMKPTDITVDANGGLKSKLEDPLTYELARALDAAKTKTESLQGENYSSMINRRKELLPYEQDQLSGKAGQLEIKSALDQIKAEGLLSPEVKTVTDSTGKQHQILNGKVIKEPTGFTLPEGVNVGDKVLDENGNETGLMYGAKGTVNDPGYITPVQQSKLDAAATKVRPTDRFTPYVTDEKAEAKAKSDWREKDTFKVDESNLNDLARMKSLNEKIWSGGIGGSVGKTATAFGVKENVEFESISNRLAKGQRIPGEGSMSNYDAETLKKTVPGTDKPKETNDKIIEAFKLASERGMEKSKAFTELFNKGYSVDQAEGFWKDYADNNRLFSEVNGELSINKPSKGFNTWFSSQKNRSVASELLKQAGGDKVKARELAKAQGYNF
jgi:hypothetical protein